MIDALNNVEPRDREKLLTSEPSLWIGQIMQLNQQPRYNNTLDAIALVSYLGEVSSSITTTANGAIW